MVSRFLDFWSPLKPCISLFTPEDVVTSSSLYWLALGEKYFLSALLGILKLSQIFSIDTPALHFFLPFEKDFLRFHAYKARPGMTASFLLSLEWCWMLSLCAFCNPTVGWLSVYAHSLSAKACSCHPQGHAQRAGYESRSEWVRHVKHWECLWDSGWDLQTMHSLACGWTSWWGSVKELVVSTSLWYVSLRTWLLLSQPLTGPQSCSSWLSILDFVRKKRASLVESFTAKETKHSLTLSHFPIREIMGQEGLSWH